MADYKTLDNSFSSAVSGTLDKNFTGGSAALFTSIDFLFRFGLVVITVVGAGMLVSSVGLLRMTGTPGNIAKSNENLKRISFGLLGVYSLITLLYTFNRDLVNGDIGLDALRVQGGGVDVVVAGGNPDEPTTTPPTTAAANPGTTGGTKTGDMWWDAINEDAQVRERLKSKGIPINKPVCKDPKETSCTTVGGLPEGTIQMLEDLQTYCNGGVYVTGGTEYGHSAHGPNKPTVDLSIGDGKLNACIRSFAAGIPMGFCHATYKKFGYTFCDEKSSQPHWHVDIR